MKRAFCAIVTKSHLAHARALGTSLQAVHPEETFYVLVVDGGKQGFTGEPFQSVALSDLNDQRLLKSMSFYYTAYEFCCAVRPWFHEYLMNNAGVSSLIFLDVDILLVRPVNEVFSLLEKSSIVLDAHLKVANTSGEQVFGEKTILKVGLYNGGIMGMRKTSETLRFLDWWKSRLARHCRFSPEKHEMVDQLWLNFVPLYFKDVRLIDNPGINVAPWNLSERRLVMDHSGNIAVNGSPLCFFHFSGWEFDKPEIISKYYPDLKIEARIWDKMVESYKSSLFKGGYDEVNAVPYAFDFFENGEPVTPAMREIYRQNTGALKNPFSDPDYFRKSISAVQSQNVTSGEGIFSRIKSIFRRNFK